MPIPSKAIHTFNVMPIKMPITFFSNLEKKQCQHSHGNTRDPK